MGYLFASLADGSAAFSAKCTGYESEAASYQDVSLSFFTSRGPLRFITSHSRATRVSRSPLRKTKRLRRRQRSRAIIKRL